MLSAPVGERRSTVGGCPWRPGLWRWLVQHRGRNFSFRLKARAFWANNFHPLCHSATPTTAQTLPIDMLCDPPRRSIVEAQQPISLHPLVSNRGESCSSPARCVPCRFPATTTRNSRTGRHGQDWPCNFVCRHAGNWVNDHEDTAPLPSKVAGFYAISEPGIDQRRLGSLNFTRTRHWAMWRQNAQQTNTHHPSDLI